MFSVTCNRSSSIEICSQLRLKLRYSVVCLLYQYGLLTFNLLQELQVLVWHIYLGRIHIDTSTILRPRAGYLYE